MSEIAQISMASELPDGDLNTMRTDCCRLRKCREIARIPNDNKSPLTTRLHITGTRLKAIRSRSCYIFMPSNVGQTVEYHLNEQTESKNHF
ncbi:hypothetical protein AVEN_266247-1 [Araneus ventricosus]|uniref:Uncharacterized protein n=1 Tax=Araneus ventricosus TaxID=182803 RepID=A0A4Y2SG79_ARAVE|nr:hypothetical protein AVEN_266247-1 [Araneus ventricosus]